MFPKGDMTNEALEGGGGGGLQYRISKGPLIILKNIPYP